MQLIKLFFIILFAQLLFTHALEIVFPVKGPEGDPSTELSLAEFDDLPIPLNSKLDKKESIIFSKKDGRLAWKTNIQYI